MIESRFGAMKTPMQRTTNSDLTEIVED